MLNKYWPLAVEAKGAVIELLSNITNIVCICIVQIIGACAAVARAGIRRTHCWSPQGRAPLWPNLSSKPRASNSRSNIRFTNVFVVTSNTKYSAPRLPIILVANNLGNLVCFCKIHNHIYSLLEHIRHSMSYALRFLHRNLLNIMECLSTTENHDGLNTQACIFLFF